MIVQFRFNNFKSFKNETTLDMIAEPISDFKDRPYTLKTQSPSERILTCAAVFGANASGKSNLIEAMKFMKEFVLEMGFSKNEFQPFLLSTDELDSEFEMTFLNQNGNTTYNYGFTIRNNEIREEWLNVKAQSSQEFKRIFYRDGDQLELQGLKNEHKKLIEASFSLNSLILSNGALLNIPILKQVFNFFNEIQFFDAKEFDKSLKIIPNYFYKKRIPESELKQLSDFLNSFDSSINGLKLKESSGDKVELVTEHKLKDGTVKEFKLDMESAGTLKMLNLYFYLKFVLETGGVLVVDELSNHLHSNLLRYILVLFLNKETNPNYAQIIFTSYDIWLLSNELFRRDEIWFVDKDEDNISSLYSLYDIVDENEQRIRKDEKFNKNYVLGEYGGVPYIKGFSFFDSINDNIENNTNQ